MCVREKERERGSERDRGENKRTINRIGNAFTTAPMYSTNTYKHIVSYTHKVYTHTYTQMYTHKVHR